MKQNHKEIEGEMSKKPYVFLIPAQCFLTQAPDMWEVIF